MNPFKRNDRVNCIYSKRSTLKKHSLYIIDSVEGDNVVIDGIRYAHHRFSMDKKCIYCERVLEDSDMTMEHLVPKAMGGGNSKNMVLCCYKCNHSRGSYMELITKFRVLQENEKELSFKKSLLGRIFNVFFPCKIVEKMYNENQDRLIEKQRKLVKVMSGLVGPVQTYEATE